MDRKEAYKELYNKRFQEIKDSIIFPNFPVEGVNFIDIFPLINNTCFEDVRDVLCPVDEDIIIFPEARGFLFADAMDPSRAVFLRKKGKLPGDLIEITYKKEYGEDKLYLQKQALLNLAKQTGKSEVSVCVFDDVAATCGTADAIISTLDGLELDGIKFKVTSAKFYIMIKELNGFDLLRKKHPSLVVEALYEY